MIYFFNLNSKLRSDSVIRTYQNMMLESLDLHKEEY